MAKHSLRYSTIPKSHFELLQTKCSAIACTLREDGMLSAHPVSFLWDGERLRFSTLKGRQKVRNLQADPRIGLCIVDPANDLHYLAPTLSVSFVRLGPGTCIRGGSESSLECGDEPAFDAERRQCGGFNPFKRTELSVYIVPISDISWS